MNDLTAGLTMEALKYGSVGLLAFGLFLTAWAATSDESGIVWRYWGRYTSAMERQLRLMFIFTKGANIAFGQMGALVLLFFAQVMIGIPYWGLVLVAIIAGPMLWIQKMRREYVEKLEIQLDSFILALANALKTTPSIGQAFQTITTIILEPFRSEVELAMKEMKVGSSLDQSLLHMAARIGSRQVDSALSAILIGRQVGGNLPKVLETTAATLREMARLEGVVRTKTAEGKMQLYVLAAFPPALVFLLNMLWKGYFNPLQESIVGYLITAGCGTMWIVGVAWARKILNVDI